MSKVQKLRNEIVKFQNLAEHSKNFSRTVRTQEQLQNDYLAVIEEQKKLTDDIQKKSVLLDEERKEVALIKEGLIKSESAILQKEADFLSLQNSIEDAIKVKIKEAQDLKNEARIFIDKSSQELKKIKKDTFIAQEDLNAAMGRLEAYKANIKAEIDLVNGLRDKAQEDTTKYQTIADAARKELYTLEEEIKKKVEENKAEGKKIGEAINGLMERERQIEKRERNFLILKLRLAKVLDKLYPGQNIDNLI